MKTITLILMGALWFGGCAFKEDSGIAGGSGYRRYSGFVPKDTRMKEGATELVLIDVIDVPTGEYELDQSKAIKGRIEYPIEYPIFEDTWCTGLGYAVSYEPRRRGIGEKLKLVAFKNGQIIGAERSKVAPSDKIQIAVYTDRSPISEFSDSEILPTEFTKSLQPSNRCRYMCTQARVKPNRKLKIVPGQTNCNYYIWGYANNWPTATVTEDAHFIPYQLERSESRPYHIKNLIDCEAVKDNEDLRNYYDQTESKPCIDNTPKVFMRQWYFVEQKINFKPPIYSILNFSEYLKSKAEDQAPGILDRPIHPFVDWSN
jgi:hypothetical protein